MIGRPGLFQRVLAMLLLAVLAGCATPPATAPDGAFWTGRLALNIAAEPPQSLSAAFELRGSARAGELALISPLGQTVAMARWTAAEATLQQGAHITSFTDMAALSEQLTGAALPLDALFRWLRGEEADVPGWSADLSGWGDGRIVARRLSPPPRAELRIRLQP